jgi:hypothetical protein
MRSDPRLLSEPKEVEWQGWKSDTYSLQRAGWKLAIEYDHMRQVYSLLMHHEQMKLYAISHEAQFNMKGGRDWFQVVRVCGDIQFTVRSHFHSFEFEAIDARPQYVDAPIRSVKDTNIFAPFTQMKEIIIDKADMSVVEHLEAIKRLQEPAQAEIRKKILDAPEEKNFLNKNVVVQLVEYRKTA